MQLIIKDKNDIRDVHIRGRHYVRGRFLTESTFEIFYSEELLKTIFDVLQEYFKDDIDRAEDPAYLKNPLTKFLDHYSIDLRGHRILDFGCGSGASSVILAQLGAGKVVGVDVDERRLSIAQLRVRDYGFSGIIDLHLLSNTNRLPFEDSSFDLVVCMGVIEHVHYKQRRVWLQEIWRVLAPGGYLVILETPNRLWPKDIHTTGLWFLPYLPPRVACAYAKLMNAENRTHTFEELLGMGIRGATYWEIVGPIKDDTLIEMNSKVRETVDRFFPLNTAKRQGLVRRSLKRLVRSVFRATDVLILRPFKIPFTAISPELKICLRKAPTSH